MPDDHSGLDAVELLLRTARHLAQTRIRDGRVLPLRQVLNGD